MRPKERCSIPAIRHRLTRVRDGEPHRDTVMGALALAVPAQVGAQCCGVPVGVSFGGVDPRTGRNFVFYESYNGGMGGSQTDRRRGRRKHGHLERDEHSG